MSKFRVVLIWLSVLFVFPRLVISDEPSEIETLLVEQEQAEMRNFRSGLFSPLALARSRREDRQGYKKGIKRTACGIA